MLLQSARGGIIEIETATSFELDFSKNYSCSNTFAQGAIETVPAWSTRRI